METSTFLEMSIRHRSETQVTLTLSLVKLLITVTQLPRLEDFLALYVLVLVAEEKRDVTQ